jgi:cyclopropane fatty-acyl-phospholipid synthase-like methyltransferase
MKAALQIKKRLAKFNRSLFSKYYSVTDDPIEVPVQVAAYELIVEKYLKDADAVLDVGFGLCYGLNLMAKKAAHLAGVEVDPKALKRAHKILDHAKKFEIKLYDGYNLPFAPKSFDVISCIDVIEHVDDYKLLIRNMCAAARRLVVISTPNRRPEYTQPDGSPMNPWHLREWSFPELEDILRTFQHPVEWNFINGPWEGPFSISEAETEQTMALTPAIFVSEH